MEDVKNKIFLCNDLVRHERKRKSPDEQLLVVAKGLNQKWPKIVLK
jgi:hypothetical protein